MGKFKCDECEMEMDTDDGICDDCVEAQELDNEEGSSDDD